MKTKLTLIVAIAMIAGLISCDSASYKKLKTGIMYKIISGGGKDSIAVNGNVVKFEVVQKLNDSLLYSSHGKMPAYLQLRNPPEVEYNPWDVLYKMKKGDSAVIVEFYDTLVKKGFAQQLPFTGKKGDRINSYIKVVEVFRKDSLARIAYNADMLKDKPRQEAEMKEAQAKQAEEIKKQMAQQLEELKKSGELAREEKEVEAYIAAKKVTTVKAPGGTYVQIKQKGTGEPAAAGKFITVKYSGRILATDSVFESNQYIFPLGQHEVIAGWDDGISLLNKGGVATLYIPGYLAYGKTDKFGRGPYTSLIFDIEILNVSDTQEKAYADKQTADSIAAAKTAKPVKK